MVREGGHPGGGGVGVTEERIGKRSTQKTVSEIAKRYNKIKGENKWGHFLMGQNFKMQSRPIYKLPLILVQTLN